MGKWYRLMDEDPMPFGKYEGVRMDEVPKSYLLWLYKDGEMQEGNLKEYIEEQIKSKWED